MLIFEPQDLETIDPGVCTRLNLHFIRMLISNTTKGTALLVGSNMSPLHLTPEFIRREKSCQMYTIFTMLKAPRYMFHISHLNNAIYIRG